MKSCVSWNVPACIFRLTISLQAVPHTSSGANAGSSAQDLSTLAPIHSFKTAEVGDCCGGHETEGRKAKAGACLSSMPLSTLNRSLSSIEGSSGAAAGRHGGMVHALQQYRRHSSLSCTLQNFGTTPSTTSWPCYSCGTDVVSAVNRGCL